MALFADSTLFLISILILISSGSLLVKTLVVIGKYFHLSDFATGFIIMAIATSIPETFVAFSAGFNNSPTLSLGDALGSSFVELTLILGISLILARNITIKHESVKKNIIYMMALSVAPFLLLADKRFSRIDGLILIAIFALYFFWVIKKQPRSLNKIDNSITRKKLAKSMLFFFLGLIALLISAHYVVESAVSIATDFGIPLLTIGLVGVGLGTALPELVFGVRSVLEGKKEMSLGDTIGSVVVNSTLVLGILAVIRPFSIVNYYIFSITAIFFLGAISIGTIFVLLRKELNWVHGFILLMFYILFIAVQVRIA